jgi:hypothetical protein
MALFKFSSPVLPEGMTFAFGSWICIANGVGGFRRHTVDVTIRPKMLTARLDEFVDNLDELSSNGSARETEAETNYSDSLSALEKDLDSLLQAGKSRATACRGAADHLADNRLMITTTPEGRFIHWKGMELLATIEEGSTELVEASSDELTSRQVLMAEEGEDNALIPIGALDGISEDEDTANASDKNDTERDVRWAKNRARATRRRRVNEHMRSVQRELDAEFTVVSERGFRTPVANIARVTAILKHSNDPNVRQALRFTQRAWIQLDQQNPASAIRDEHVGESHSQAPSQTAGGCPRPQRSNNNDIARGSQATGGRQQPPPGGNPQQADLR